MRRPDLLELTSFVVVARERSFRRAAAELSMSPSALSRSMRSLEHRLGAKLINRTTRSVSLTEAGAGLLARIEPAFAEIDAAASAAQAETGPPRGRVRLSVPKIAATLALAPWIGRFAESYPDITLEISVSDGLVDIVAERFDAGIRLLERVPRDMVAVPVTPELRGIVVASPTYLSGRPLPLVPDDLKNHRCINYRQFSSRTTLPWEFEHHTTGEVRILPVGSMTTDDADLIVAAVLGGAGLAMVTEASVKQYLATGALVSLLDPWCKPFPGLHLYYPPNRHMSAALRAVVDSLKNIS